MTLAAFSLALFVLSALPAAASDRVVIVQTNAAGDNVFLIDPSNNTIVGEIGGIEVAGRALRRHLRAQERAHLCAERLELSR